MKLNEVYKLIDGVCLVKHPKEDTIRYGNIYLPDPTEEMMEMEVEDIHPFYKRGELFRFGVIIHLKDEENQNKEELENE